MKVLWVCVLLSMFSVAAFSGFSDTLSGPGQALIEMAGSRSFAAAPPPRAGTGIDDALSDDLSTYVFLHKTRNESVPLQAATRANVCPDPSGR